MTWWVQARYGSRPNFRSHRQGRLHVECTNTCKMTVADTRLRMRGIACPLLNGGGLKAPLAAITVYEVLKNVRSFGPLEVGRLPLHGNKQAQRTWAPGLWLIDWAGSKKRGTNRVQRHTPSKQLHGKSRVILSAHARESSSSFGREPSTLLLLLPG